MRQNRVFTAIRPILPLLLLIVAAAAAACPESQYREADHAFSVAREPLMSKNWVQAIPALESALAICPEHVNSLRYLGKAYYETERYADARIQQEALIEAAGQDAKYTDYMALGKTYAQLDEDRLARQAYVNASRLDPDNCAVLFNLAVMHGAVNDYARSVETFEAVIDNCPDLKDKAMPHLVKACQKAAERERRFGNVAEADLYEQKRGEYGSQAGGSAGYQLIVDRMKAEDYAGAVQQCRAFLDNNPDSSRRDRVLLNMARSQGQLKDYGAAIESYRAYLELKPNDGESAGALVESLVDAERCEEALATAAEAHARIQDTEQRVFINFYWGSALECVGQYQEAKDKFNWVEANASGDLKYRARNQVTRQEQYLERERLQRQNAGY